MKKSFKKVISCILSAGMITSSALALSVSADETMGAVMHQCPQCSVGVVSDHVTREKEHDETFPCSHYKNGTDVYHVYKITHTVSCNHCSYENKQVTEEHVLGACNGFGEKK